MRINIYQEKPDTSQITTNNHVKVPWRHRRQGICPSKILPPQPKIREKWLNNHRTKRVFEVLLVVKGTRRVNCKDKLCYQCRIPKIDNGTVFHIYCANFKIEGAPSSTFEDEIIVRTVVADPQYPERERTTALRESVADVAPNVNGRPSQEISELHHQGIEVNDENEPARENAQPSAPAT